ncbi:aluminum-activated malate transporter 10-like [Lolium rigidum]|uniref:aluminum-activated malate transporter 10-like n=1 Tax=Lolium rigidum TaxID=89674 RepID=UPI001F5CF08C|nr:aluminum-activated malate transporter 10-like [Lolium rigidum]
MDHNHNAREWQVSMPEDAAVSAEHKAAGAGQASRAARAWAWPASCAAMFRSKLSGFAGKMIGAADYSGKAVYGMKVALALTLVSLFYYARPLYDGVGGRNVVWAIMTVVLVFEYTVGGSMYKGFNRTVGTISGAGLALAVHWVASKSGKTLEPVVASGSVFLLAAAAAFSRFIPLVKSLYDYGVTVFIITYSFVAVSGYRVEDLAAMALQRISTISIGFAICIAVCLLVFPVWSGHDLRLITTRNMDALADSIEACVDNCFADDTKRPARGSRSEGYKCVLGSKASEDAQAILARWEPAHGEFTFRHPYHLYTKVGAAMRQCAYCVEALHGRVVLAGAAPDQAPALHLIGAGGALAETGIRCTRVLREASRSVATMTASGALGVAVADMDAAVRALQSDVRALPSKLLLLSDDPSLAEASMALLPMALLIIEIATRVRGVVDAVGTLASAAGFELVEDGDGHERFEVLPLENLRCSDASTVNLPSTATGQPLSRTRNPSSDQPV